MGVRGLQSNVKEKGLTSNILFKDLSRSKALPTSNNSLHEIVVDTHSLLHHYLFCKATMAYGGEYNQLYNAVGRIISRFKEIDVELVFFYGGSVEVKKRDEWCLRRKRNLLTVDRRYAQINVDTDSFRATDIEREMHRHFTVPVNAIHYFRKMLLELGQKVYRSVGECDDAMAEYAVRHVCLAIMTDDSDFLIYDTKIPCISISNFNINKMSSIIYDQRKLCDYLNLRVELLPLVASLNGNDYVPFTVTHKLHSQISTDTGINDAWKFQRMTKYLSYVQSILPPATTCDTDSLIKSTVDFVTRSYPFLRKDLLTNSIEAYRITNDEPEIPWIENTLTRLLLSKQRVELPSYISPRVFVDLARQHLMGKTCGTLLTLLARNDIEWGVSFQDRLGTCGLKPYGDVYQRLHKNWCSVLLNVTGERDVQVVVKNWNIASTLTDPNDLRPMEFHLEPVLDGSGLPLGIDKLWRADATEKIRLEALYRILSLPPSLNCNNIPLPKRVWPLFLLVLYIALNADVTAHEIELMLFFILELHGSVEMKAPPDRLHPRGVHLAALYSRGISFIDGTLDLCHLNNNKPQGGDGNAEQKLGDCKFRKYFSGEKFQYLYWWTCVGKGRKGRGKSVSSVAALGKAKRKKLEKCVSYVNTVRSKVKYCRN